MVAGIGLVAGSAAIGLGPIAFVSGALLLWTGIVKAIVLRIWRATLRPDSVPDGPQYTRNTGIAARPKP
jgi:hypothetical protein